MAKRFGSISKLSDHSWSKSSNESQLIKISSLNKIDEIKNTKENVRKESLKSQEKNSETGDTSNVSVGLGSIESLLGANLSREESLNSRELFTGSIQTSTSKQTEKSEETKSISGKSTSSQTFVPQTPQIPEAELIITQSQLSPSVQSEVSHRSQLLPPTPSELSRQSQLPDDISVVFPDDFGVLHSSSSMFSFANFTSAEFIRSDAIFNMPIISEEEEISTINQRLLDDLKFPIDRKLYYEMYSLWEKRKRNETIKNIFLQTCLAKYYIKRNMRFVCRETSFKWDEIIIKYQRDLDRLSQLYEYSEREKAMLLDEVKYLEDKRNTKKADHETIFRILMQLERDYAKCLTFDKTGRTNMDELVERLIRRQKVQIALLADLRLRYIQLRNRCQEKMEAMDALDHLGPGYRIMDYVQLKTDNRNLSDKYDEKETELIKLREVYKRTTQILAHYREKKEIIDLDIQKMRDTLEEVEKSFKDAREQLSFLTHEKDLTRRDIKKLRDDYGLLTYPKLLRDMESSGNEIEVLKDKIELLQTSFYNKQRKIEAVRRNMELIIRKRTAKKAAELLETRSSDLLRVKSSHGSGKKSVSIVLNKTQKMY